MEAAANARSQRGVNKYVIQAPSDISFPDAASHAPPRVLAAFGMKDPKRIYKPLSQNLAEPRSLLGQKSSVLLVGSRIAQITFFEGHVQVASNQDWVAAAPEGSNERQEASRKGPFMFQPL
jgi:hypothetical protein